MPLPLAEFSEIEKLKVLMHLGYPVTNPVASIQLGFPAMGQPAFLASLGTSLIPAIMVTQIRQYINVLDGLNQRLVDAVERLQAKKVGEIELNPDELDQIDAEYHRWAQILADAVGAYINRYSARFAKYFGGVNRRVVHS